MNNSNQSFIRPVLIISAMLLTVVVFIGLAMKSRQELYISEVVAHNDRVIYDSVGFYHDYIVLSNASDQVIDLTGYGLSDDRVDLQKYVFSSVQIEPQGSLLIWSDVPAVFAGVFKDETALYTGFRLKDHESLFLTDPDGNVVDSLRLPALKRNQAYLRSETLRKWKVGTPREQDADPPVISAAITPPELSVPSGYYLESFDLTINGKGEIYYTVDGSSPYTSGMLYSEPISVYDRNSQPNYYASLGPVSLLENTYMPTEPVNKAMVVRAVIRRADGMFSEETVATYWIGEPVIRSCQGAYMLSIVANPEDLFSGARGIYVTGNVWEMNQAKAEELEANPYLVPTNYNSRGKGWRKDARLILFDPAGNCLYDEEDTISIHGNWARSLNQKGFNLRPKQLDGAVLAELIPETGNTLVLRTGGTDDVYLTNFRDALNSKVAENLQVGAQRSLCCQVYLNGEYWGCYNLQDRLDESFIEARYGVPATSVNLIKNFEAVSEIPEDLEDYQKLEDFVREHDFFDDLQYGQFCNMVDIDSLIDYYCAEIYFANDDAYDNNVALWKTRKAGTGPYADGKWRFLLIDTDCSTGYRDSVSASVDTFVEGQCREYNPNTELYFSNLIKNATFRKQFRERFLYLASHDFSYERVEPIITEFEQTYSKPMVQSMRRFADPAFTEESYVRNVQTVRDFYKERGNYICEYLMQHLDD